MCVEGRGLNSLIEFNQESNEMGGFGKHQEANVQENERKYFFSFCINWLLTVHNH